MLPEGGVGAEELHGSELAVQLFQAVSDDLVAQVSFELDDKAVVTEAQPGGTRLDLGEIEVPSGELPEDLVQVTGAVGLLEAHKARAIVAGRR